ncbi:MAG: hypothetical protein M1134_03640, partial [Actinobacteria bacterium]|nr:hypothetical protein [Actinomycetota bacterium]
MERTMCSAVRLRMFENGTTLSVAAGQLSIAGATRGTADGVADTLGVLLSATVPEGTGDGGADAGG